MNHPACKVECARSQDIPAMLSLEKRYFDPCWHSDPRYVKRLVKKEPMMFRVCKINDEVRGFYWVVPLDHSTWQKVLNGEMDESEAMANIKSFDDANLYLYICSVVVDLADKQHKQYTKALVKDFGRNFVQPGDTPDISAIGAFTISEGGRRLMERSNYNYRGSFMAGGKKVRSYAIKRSILAQQVNAARLKKQQRKIA